MTEKMDCISFAFPYFKLLTNMGQQKSRYQPVAVEEIESSSLKTEYIPVESFLINIKDNVLICWIMDNIGVLRSMFKIGKLEKNKCIYFKGCQYTFIQQHNIWQITSSTNTVVRQESLNDNYVFHFIDGTAVMILGDTIYHLHFEECPDEVFDEMKKEKETKTIRKKKRQEEVEIYKVKPMPKNKRHEVKIYEVKPNQKNKRHDEELELDEVKIIRRNKRHDEEVERTKRNNSEGNQLRRRRRERGSKEE
ncbi:hypothetical protein BH23THE1_BH23THE1_35860 [soil metagenome]